jgi:hypothetical protein
MMREGMRPLRGASRYLPVCLDQERASDRCTCRPIGAGDCAVVRLRSGLEKSLDLAQRGWAFSCTCTAGLIHFIHYWLQLLLSSSTATTYCGTATTSGCSFFYRRVL